MELKTIKKLFKDYIHFDKKTILITALENNCKFEMIKFLIKKGANYTNTNLLLKIVDTKNTVENILIQELKM